MKKHLLILAVLSSISLSAYAKDNGDDCNGRGSCSTSTPSNSNATATGIANANANSRAYGGSVKSEIENSVNNTNKNSNVTDINNSNKNSNYNTIHTSNKNYNDNTNTNSNKNYNDNSNSNKNTQKQNQNQGQSQSTENSNNAQQTVNVQGDSIVYKAPDIPVSSAIAPPAFPTAPCRIALSAGLSLMNVGGSFGGSVLDSQCDLRASAQAFAAVGDIESAEYLLCNLDASKKLPKCQSKLAILNATAPKENTQTQLSSIIK